MPLTTAIAPPTIYKYQFHGPGIHNIEMPLGAYPFSCGIDGSDTISVWAQVYPDETKVNHRFLIVGTGHPFPKDAHPGLPLGTVNMPGEALWKNLIWHVWDLGEGT